MPPNTQSSFGKKQGTKVSDQHTIAILGAGSWGTALGVLIAHNGYKVLLWGHDPEHMKHLEKMRENVTFLPGVSFPTDLHTYSDLTVVLRETSEVLIAVPSHAYRITLQALKVHLSNPAMVAWATKGLEPGTGKLLSQVVHETLGGNIATGVISGPSFATEVARNLPAALTVAASNAVTAETIANWLRNDRVRVYTSSDVAGVQLGGAIKNVMAIAAGISDGLGFGANARAALITRGLAELTRLGVAMGGSIETFMGLTGAGDLILTCTDDTSRNRQVGLALGKGKTLDDILEDLGQEAEGVATAKELYQLAKRMNVDMPITEQVYRVLYENVAPHEAVEALLKREAKAE